ncbi:MAG: Carboxyl-terminal protease [candidate division TM6 bacterium GW2011_GWF2_37_49]|nr:MAG: Carboxyl-terminal protease [candidate division TM6 bacterium GW2011_GWF2_37_49]
MKFKFLLGYCCAVAVFATMSAEHALLVDASIEESKIVDEDSSSADDTSEAITETTDIVVDQASKEAAKESSNDDKKEVDNESDKKDEKAESKDYNSEKDILQWFQTYSEAVATIEKKAFRKVDFQKFIKDSLKLAISNVDAHSAFFDNEEFKNTLETTTGEFSGIGVSIIGKAIDDDALLIIDVVQGGPAHKAGLKRGDKIISVNKDTLKGLSTDEVINKLKGKTDTEVNLKIIRAKKPLSFTIKRELIKDQTAVCYCFKEQRVYYLSLKHFAEIAAKQVKDLLEKANKGKCKGIILDLRSNPGGTLDSAIDMAGLFLPKNSLVCSTKDRNGKTVAEYFTRTDPVLKSDVPIIILINNFTASASEILAGCLQYHSQKIYESGKNDRKFMVFLAGTTTFGKGSVQELIPVKNGCALKLTTMLYFLPGVKSIQAQGVEPDFEVKAKIVPEEDMKWIKELYGKESSLKNYITENEVRENLGLKPDPNKKSDGKEKSDKKEVAASQEFGDDENGSEPIEKIESEEDWQKKQIKALGEDNQVLSCVNMINMLHMIKKCKKDKKFTRQRAFTMLKKNYLVDVQPEIEKVH